MSSPCAKMVEGASIHCEPQGTLKQYGWLPGTWVKWVNVVRVFTKGAVASADICSNTDFPFGFITVGSQTLKNGFDNKYANENEKYGLWTSDETVQFTSKYHNEDIQFDSNHQLSMLGTGILTAVINHEGVFKFYVYEKYNKAYRDTAGSGGGVLDWESAIGVYNVLHISDRGLLTCEKENVNSYDIPRAVADVGTDEVGKFIVTVGL